MLLSASFHLLVAQSHRIESLTIADGLSQGMIFDIEQTQDGFLWFATKDGLNRYDGYHFEIYTNDPFNPFSIAGNEVIKLFEDSHGNLWMSLMGRGLDMLEKKSGRFFHLSQIDDLSLKSAIYDIAEASDSSIWLATTDGLLQVKVNESDFFDIENPDLIASSKVELVIKEHTEGREGFTNLIANPDGTLFVSSNYNQTYKYNPTQKQFTPILSENLALYTSSVTGRAWAVGQGSMYVLEKDSARKICCFEYPPKIIFHTGSDDLLWSYFDGKRTYFYSISEEEIYRTGSAVTAKLIFDQDKHAPSGFIDRSGNFWVGSSGYGLLKTQLRQNPFQHFLKGRSIRNVFSADGIHVQTDGNPDLFSKLNETTDQAFTATDLFPVVTQLYLAKNKTIYAVGYDFHHTYL